MEVESASQAVKGFLRRIGVDDDACWRTEAAVREAVANAIVHGNREDPGKQVGVAVELGGGRLVVRVHDEGPGWDGKRLADPRDTTRRLEPRGRGVFLMRHFMDEVVHDRRAGGGTTVTMSTRLQDPARPPRGAYDPEPREAGMTLTSRRHGDASVFEAVGKITIGAGAVRLREEVLAALEGGARNVVIDMGRVTAIDSSGIGALVSAYSATANGGGRLALCRVPPKVLEILHITQLSGVFELFPGEREAVAELA
ncbi:anti-anti-sigma factor [Nannocystis exedens]|uniref:Anti-sigma factor antagonist n=1 Tax=Nannocystis exedens TaxID=54 RepID=A0A1I1ZTQ9_9BACT|nr:anti-sigma factor antagonist [Nannocystis exedens]SFE35046.1 anti-anti-sigma factor [Nannocystis exedens]